MLAAVRHESGSAGWVVRPSWCCLLSFCSASAVLSHVQLTTGLGSPVSRSRSQTTHLVLQIGCELSGAGTSLGTS